MKTLSAKSKLVIIVALVLIGSMGTAETALAQTTVFAYQGRLDFDGVPTNGNYDFQFRLFDAVSGGTQQGDYEEQLNITVTNGAYTVNLDFGGTVFLSIADRFLEVSYRATGSSTYTTLSPRQLVTTTPYSIHSAVANTAHVLDSTCTSCVTSSQIQNVQGYQVTGNVAGSQIAGTIPVASVPAGSGNYIQNTISQQPNSNFNIGGSGIAGGLLSGNLVNSTTGYNIAGVRVLGYAASNLSVGINAGNANTTGLFNLSVGTNAGSANTASYGNSFFGFFAGQSNTTGSHNSFIGSNAGDKNTTGGYNSFVGGFAGGDNTTGQFNSFFGYGAGRQSFSGSGNTFIGYGAAFISTNSTGDNNTLLGYNAMVKSGVSNSAAIGTAAQAVTSHTVVLGTSQEIVIVPGKLEVGTLGVAGNQQLCLNNSNRVSPCSSSLRYKTDLRLFSDGLSIINRLQPVTFTWKDGGLHDVGFGAEDVQKIEPLLVTYNTQGQVEGVKYDRITVALVNAIKEQQTQISELKGMRAENAELKAQLADVVARLQQLEKTRVDRK